MANVRAPYLLLLLAVAACDSRDAAAPAVDGGDPVLGARLVNQFQCGSCHVIPEIAAAQGRTGPTLAMFGRRSYIAGSVPNFPDALARFIVNPAAVKPGTTMPAMGVSPQEARHMAAYLGTLR